MRKDDSEDDRYGRWRLQNQQQEMDPEELGEKARAKNDLHFLE